MEEQRTQLIIKFKNKNKLKKTRIEIKQHDGIWNVGSMVGCGEHHEQLSATLETNNRESQK
jgi:hypothetical protein